MEAYIDDQQHPGWMTFDPTPSAGAQPLGDTTGAWVYMRDVVEALSQRWNHYVIGYDLRSQVHLYDWFRDTPTFGKWKRELLIAGGIALVAFVIWRRRRRRIDAPRPNDALRNEPHVRAATSMYRLLEHALVSHGLTRPVSLPPLRSPRISKRQSHPLAPEVIDLTGVYLGVRFGGAELTQSLLRTFDRRVRAVREWKRPTPPTA